MIKTDLSLNQESLCARVRYGRTEEKTLRGGRFFRHLKVSNDLYETEKVPHVIILLREKSRQKQKNPFS